MRAKSGLSSLTISFLQKLTAKLQAQFDQATTPSNFLANLLHPRYMGQKLSAEQQEVARQLLNTHHPTLLPLTLAFQAKTLLCGGSV